MRTYQVISADGHLEGPFDWSKRMPAKYKDAVPKLIQLDDGAYAWRLDYAGVERLSRVDGATLYCGSRYDEFVPSKVKTYWNADGSPRPGTSADDPVQRLREQDQDGIDAEVLFWPGSLFAVAQYAKQDPDAYKAAIRMYTDFIAEYCSIAPDRLIGNHVLPWTGVDDAIAEITHARDMGIRTVTLQNWPNGSGSPAPEDDRFWAAALDLEMRLSPHQAFGDQTVPPGGSAITPEYVLAGQNVMGKTAFTTTLAQLMYQGVFDRFPTIKFYFAETQGAWLANHLDYVDEFYMRWAAYHDLNLKLKKLPSEYIRDHCKFSFIHDRMVMKLRYYIGLDLLMWGSDHPHSVGTFPDSQETLDDLFEGVPEEERRQVLVDNVCEFFGLDPLKELTPTP